MTFEGSLVFALLPFLSVFFSFFFLLFSYLFPLLFFSLQNNCVFMSDCMCQLRCLCIWPVFFLFVSFSLHFLSSLSIHCAHTYLYKRTHIYFSFFPQVFFLFFILKLFKENISLWLFPSAHFPSCVSLLLSFWNGLVFNCDIIQTCSFLPLFFSFGYYFGHQAPIMT